MATRSRKTEAYCRVEVKDKGSELLSGAVRVQDGHGAVGDTSVRVDLLEDCDDASV